MRRIAVGLVLLVGAFGCGGDDSSDTINDVTIVTTPRPDAAQSGVIESGVAAIYPGVPEGKATDWAVSTCRDMLDGKDEATLIRNVTLRYSGGDRPDPTTDQAAAILDVVRSAGFCV